MAQSLRIASVVGRGHSGTRAGAGLLTAAGYDIGVTNGSSDSYPFEPIYRAARICLSHATQLGPRRWDLERLTTCPIPAAWHSAVEEYLDVVRDRGPLAAWKLPETLLSWPWFVRAYPEVRWITWLRDPRDAVLRKHGTDDLGRWGLEGWPHHLPDLEERALSWVLQFQLLQVAQAPRQVRVRLRDYVLDQHRIREEVGKLLGVEVPLCPVRPEVLGRWPARRPEFGRAWQLLQPYFGLFTDDPLPPVRSGPLRLRS